MNIQTILKDRDSSFFLIHFQIITTIHRLYSHSCEALLFLKLVSSISFLIWFYLKIALIISECLITIRVSFWIITLSINQIICLLKFLFTNSLDKYWYIEGSTNSDFLNHSINDFIIKIQLIVRVLIYFISGLRLNFRFHRTLFVQKLNYLSKVFFSIYLTLRFQLY